MTPAEARALLLRFDGFVRHSEAAGLTLAEEIAIALRAAGLSDRRIARAARYPPSAVPMLLERAASKLLAYHRLTARGVLGVCENRPEREPATYEDLTTGEEVEIQSMQNAEDERVRVHPNLLPTVEVLTAPLVDALEVVLDPGPPVQSACPGLE